MPTIIVSQDASDAISDHRWIYDLPWSEALQRFTIDHADFVGIVQLFDVESSGDIRSALLSEDSSRLKGTFFVTRQKIVFL